MSGLPRLTTRHKGDVDAVGRTAGNPVDTMLGRAAPSSVRNVRAMLNRMARHFSGGRLDAWGFPWWELTYGQVADFRALVAREYAPASAKNYMATLRAVLKECKRFGLLDPTQYDKLTDIPPVRGDTLPPGRHITAAEINKLFAHLDTLDNEFGARDRAVIALLRGTGIRRAEACALTLDCWDAPKKLLTVNKGKGNKQRQVHLPDWVVDYVDSWLWHRGTTPGALFCALDKHGNVYHRRHLDPVVLGRYVTRRVAEAGVEHFTPHDLRRTYAGDQLEAGHDLVKVQKAMGHASPEMTARYDRRGLASRKSLATTIPAPGARAPGTPNRAEDAKFNREFDRPGQRPWVPDAQDVADNDGDES
jgi:integrase/recombinase XerD